MSVVHIGGLQITGLKQACELEVYSQAKTIGLVDSLTRAKEEAAMLGADGVFVTAYESKRIAGEEHEYACVGTALRYRAQPGALRTRNGHPFAFDSSLAVLYTLLRRGMRPVDRAWGVCVYHVPHRTLRQTLRQTFQNTEVPVFTEAWQTARELAVARLQGQLDYQGAQVMVEFQMDIDAEEFGEHTAVFAATALGVCGRGEPLCPVVDFTPIAFAANGVTGVMVQTPLERLGAASTEPL